MFFVQTFKWTFECEYPPSAKRVFYNLILPANAKFPSKYQIWQHFQHSPVPPSAAQHSKAIFLVSLLPNKAILRPLGALAGAGLTIYILGLWRLWKRCWSLHSTGRITHILLMTFEPWIFAKGMLNVFKCTFVPMFYWTISKVVKVFGLILVHTSSMKNAIGIHSFLRS